MNTVYAAVNRYVPRSKATDSVAEEMDYLGLEGSVLILCGPTVGRLLHERWNEVLGKAGISHEVMTLRW